MKKFYFLFFFGFFCLFSPTLFANSLEDKIHQALKESHNPKGRVGISIRNLSTGEVIFEKNSRELFIPASNMKLLTTGAALEYLGAYYTFSTKIYGTGSRSFGKLAGDLWIVGGGDPNISGRFYKEPQSLLQSWASRLKNSGLHRIEGDLVMDDRLLDRQWVHPLWPGDQLSRWYCAEVSALTLNDNCIDLTLVGGSRAGRAGRVVLAPPTSYVKILNYLKTSTKRSSSTCGRDQKNQISLKGFVLRNRKTELSVAIHNPPLYFGQVLKETLEKEGIEFQGKVRLARADEKMSGGVLYLEHRSLLRNVLPVINKRSQNLHCEILFKLLGKKLFSQGSFEGGQKAIEGFLKKAGVEGPYSISDGSGMSRANKISPHQMTSLLIWISKQPYGKLYRSSLSLAGKDGTLRKRLRKPFILGKVCGKTGTLDGVSALSGYGWNGREWYVFSLLTEEFPGWKAKKLQDQIVEALMEE